MEKNIKPNVGKLKAEEDVKELIKALKNRDEGSVSEAIDDLCGIGTAAVKPLILALKDEDHRIRCNAAKALGKLNDPEAIEPLIQTLKDRNNEVRRVVAIALGDIGDKRADKALTQVLRDKNDGSVRLSAVKALVKIRR